MCYTALIGAAIAAAGTGVQMAAARKSQQAMNRQVVAGLQKQDEFQRQATPIFNQSLEESGPKAFQESQRQAESQSQGLYEEVAGTGTNPLPVDKSRLKLQVGQSRKTNAQGQGFREGFSRWGVGNSEAQNQLGIISKLAGSSAQNNHILTSMAGSAGADMASIGSLLSTAGSLAAMYGAVNANRTPKGPLGTSMEASNRDWSKVA